MCFMYVYKRKELQRENMYLLSQTGWLNLRDLMQVQL